jgi:16S rRNA (guanine527-N7)-methyltransferase
MTETEARDNIDVPRETLDRLVEFVALLQEENDRQNLVSRASLEEVWSRHILDSVQLLRFSADGDSWVDLGSGAGFPGLVVAIVRPGPVTLVESRKLRADFLKRASRAIGLADRVEIICSRVEAIDPRPFDIISARAFAPLGRLLDLGERFAASTTRWVLPKGKNAKSELAAVAPLWQGVFRLEPSITDPDAHIIVAEQVRRKPRGRSRG